jgi:hypothetical protein
LLLKRFQIFEINEYNTSKLYNKTFREQQLTKSTVLEGKSTIFLELENVTVRKNKHKKHLHEILTPKEKTERRIFVNRDKNACKNILFLGKCYLENQTRPSEFSAKTQKTEKKNSFFLLCQKNSVLNQ